MRYSILLASSFTKIWSQIVYIKGVDNIVADAISRLEYNPEINVKSLDSTRSCYALAKLFAHYCKIKDMNYRGGECSPKQTYQHMGDNALGLYSDNEKQSDITKNVFANISKDEDDIYPPSIAEIAYEQRKYRYRLYKRYFKENPFKNRDKKISVRIIDDEDILVFEGNGMIIPGTEMQSRILNW